MLKKSIKKWLFLLFVLIANLAIGLKTSIEVFYFFFWILFSFIVLSLAYISIGFFSLNLKIKRRVVSRIEEDEFLGIETVIENKGYLAAFNLIIEDFIPCAADTLKKRAFLLDFLRPRSVTNLNYRLLCPLRGKYTLGPFAVYIFDPWGIFFLKKIYPEFSEVYVYPRIFKIRNLPPLNKGVAPWFGIQSGRASGDDHDFFGVREYKPGDPVRRIHWFSTAQKNRLIVKQYQQHVFQRATIVFGLNKNSNFGTGKESVAEYTVKIAASLADYLLKQNVSVEIVAHAEGIVHMPFNKGEQHLEQILRFLAAAKAESMIDLNEIFQEYSRFIPDDSNLLVIMPDRECRNLSSMIPLINRNVQITPFILLSDTFLAKGMYKEEQQEIHMRLLGLFGTSPVFFSCGRNPEESFLKKVN